MASLGAVDKKTVARAKIVAIECLRELGIDDKFTLKVKDLEDLSWSAQYRGMSQFRSNPIFWIGSDHPDSVPKLTESILHEYGHVIYELARVRNPSLQRYIDGSFNGDEEAFAEAFGRATANGIQPPWLRYVASQHWKTMNEGQ